MTKHIGIVACSSEGAALCYRTICLAGSEMMSEYDHPEISLHGHSLRQYMQFIDLDNWQGVADLMVSSAQKLAQAGADFLICPDNTIHQVFDQVVARSPLPWLHIAEVVAAEALRANYRSLGILGTSYLMAGPVYPEKVNKVGLRSSIPSAAERARISEIIFSELVNGKFTNQSRAYFVDVIKNLQLSGCDAVVLGCTEIPLLIEQKDSSLPILDSTRLLAKAALMRAIEG